MSSVVHGLAVTARVASGVAIGIAASISAMAIGAHFVLREPLPAHEEYARARVVESEAAARHETAAEAAR